MDTAIDHDVSDLRPTVFDEGKWITLSLQRRKNIHVTWDLKTWDLTELTAEDIAYGLSGIYRFQGQSRYTDAEHSVHGYMLSCDPWFLLHDAGECLGFGDVNGLLKQVMDMRSYANAEDTLLCHLAKKFGITKTDVKKLDRALGNYEAHILNGHEKYTAAMKRTEQELRYKPKLHCWSPEKAAEAWLDSWEGCR